MSYDYYNDQRIKARLSEHTFTCAHCGSKKNLNHWFATTFKDPSKIGKLKFLGEVMEGVEYYCFDKKCVDAA